MQHRDSQRQVTIRRFGWSQTSEADAQQLAEARAQEALQRVLAGEDLKRRERLDEYGTEQGAPIREEILEEVGRCVITRNSYGAHCLNVPDVLFADVDFVLPRPKPSGVGVLLTTGIALVATGFATGNAGILYAGIGLLVASAVRGFVSHKANRRAAEQQREQEEKRTLARIEAFSQKHPDWHLRVYRTPNGYRLMALHRLFAPGAPETQAALKELQADLRFVFLCALQQCFRARLTGKPWRMDVKGRLPSRAWPVTGKAWERRKAWCAQYDARTREFAACRYLGSYGSREAHPLALQAMDLHDARCQALSDLPLA